MAQNLTLGRGELWFGQFRPGTLIARGERYLGNSPELAATIETETLDHFDSDHGINEKDESIPLSTNRTGNFTTDNISPENVALFFFGESFSFTVTGGAVTGEEILLVEPGLTYQLGMTEANPAGASLLSSTTLPVVKDLDTPATTYVAGTDYKVDLKLGRIEVLKGGGIPADANLTVDYTVDPSTRERVISKSDAISGALRYIAFNPAGPQRDWYMPYVKISPNGDYTLKGDTWQILPFSFEILKLPGRDAVYVDGRAYA